MSTASIIVNKIDHSSLQLTCERSIEAELQDQFSFFVPGYKFQPKYKYGLWDGKIRLYNVKTRTLPAGLFHELLSFSKENNYSIEIHEDSLPFEISDAKYDLDIPLFSHGEEITLRDYQENAINYAIQNRRCILLSPTGSGKSLNLYALFRYFKDEKFLIVTPTTSLVEQLYSDFEEYSSKDPSFDVTPETVHRIYSGHDKNNDTARAFISTWQSIYQLPKSWFEQFSAAISDEAHLCKAASLTKIMNSCTNASIRIGTTGTLSNDSKVNEMVLKGLFGPVFKATTTKDLIDNETLSQAKIQVLHVKYDADTVKDFRKSTKRDYPSEMSYITQIEKRNHMISQLVSTQKKNTLVLFNYVETHGKPLYEKIKASIDRPVYYISGEISAKEREHLRNTLEKDTNSVLVASSGTFSTGVNVRNLHNIIFASPTKSQIRVLQSLGRGLRKHGDRSLLTVYDIVDDFTRDRYKKNYALLHGIERMKIYAKEQLEFKLHEIKF